MEDSPAKITHEKVAHRREIGALRRPRERWEQEKKEATRRERSHKKHEKGDNDIREEQAGKGLRTNPTKALRSERNPQSYKKTKPLKTKFEWKTAWEKSPTKQNKNKQIARHRHRNRETEIWNRHISSKITLYIGCFFQHHRLASFFMWEVLHILSWLLLLLFFFSFFFSFFFFLSFFFLFSYLGSFPQTSCAGFIFVWRVSLTHPLLA